MAVVSRYAVALHILSWIAQMTEDNDTFVTSDRIAQSVNTSPVFIRRILKSLHDANLVIVQHGGNTPGCKLARHPDSITLRDVYEAVVEKPLFELHHSSPNPKCLIGKGIQPALNPILTRSELALKHELEQVTVSSLLHDTLAESQRS